MNLRIKGKVYDYPEGWSITIRQFIQLINLFNEHAIDEKLKKGEVDNDLLRFYIQAAGIIYGIPKDIVNNINIDDAPLLFEKVNEYLFIPDKFDAVKKFKFKGKKYHAPTSEENTVGEEIPMSGATFGEYETACTVSMQMNKLKERSIEGLPMLIATLYRPKKWFKREEYNDEVTKERAKEFLDLDMKTAWGCYFFLLTHKHSSTRDTNLYLRLVRRIAQEVSAGTQQESKSQEMGFSTNRE